MKKIDEKNLPAELDHLSEEQELELFQIEELEERFELGTWVAVNGTGCNQGCGKLK